MSSPEVDIAQLTETQQLALGTYTSVTNQDPAAAIALLGRSEWNVQVDIVLISHWKERLANSCALIDCHRKVLRWGSA